MSSSTFGLEMGKSFSPSLGYLDPNTGLTTEEDGEHVRHMKANQEDLRSPLQEVWSPLNDARPPLNEVPSPLKD